jgi:hypothetical protein
MLFSAPLAPQKCPFSGQKLEREHEFWFLCLWGLFFGTPKLEREHRFPHFQLSLAILWGLKLEFCEFKIMFFEYQHRFCIEILAFSPNWPFKSLKKLHFQSQNTGFQRFLKLQNLVFYSVRSTFFRRNRSQMQGNSVFRLLKSCCGSSFGVFPRAQKGSKSMFWSYFGPFSAFLASFPLPFWPVFRLRRASPKMAAGSPKRSPQQPQKPRLRPKRPEMSPKRLQKELPKKPKQS